MDLFSGTGSATAAFRDAADWTVTEVDVRHDPDVGIEPDLPLDIMEVEPWMLPSDVEVVWASPPCTTFSTASLGTYWTSDQDQVGGDLPTREKPVRHVGYVYRTLWLIQELEPRWWFLENPRAKLRRVAPIQPAGTVTYCQYGLDWQKPTDLYGQHPPSFRYRSCVAGEDCHQSAPRGSDGGTQSSHIRDPVERAKIPRQLSEAVLESVENPENAQSTLDSFNAS